jgi:hypothetical protein
MLTTLYCSNTVMIMMMIYELHLHKFYLNISLFVSLKFWLMMVLILKCVRGKQCSFATETVRATEQGDKIKLFNSKCYRLS